MQQEVSIDASAERVFAYLGDFNRHGEWVDHELSIEPSSAGPLGPGTTFRLASPRFGRAQVSSLTVIEFLPNERIVFETDGDDGMFRHSFLLREEDGKTHLTKIAEPTTLPLRRRLFRPLLTSVVFPHILAGQLRRIKEELEVSPTLAP